MISFVPNADELGEIRVVNEDEVANLSARGWKLLAVVHENRVSSQYVDTPTPVLVSTDQFGNMPSATPPTPLPTSCVQPFIVSVARYMMARSADTTLADAIERETQLSIALEAMTKDAHAHLETADERATKVESLTQAVGDRDQQVEALEKTRDLLEQSRDKAEAERGAVLGQLNIVRKEIGEERFRDICGANGTNKTNRTNRSGTELVVVDDSDVPF